MAGSVLLIDDDVDVLRSIGNYFERLGYEVTRELSGEAGLATFDRLRPEVVILAAGQSGGIAANQRYPAVLALDTPLVTAHALDPRLAAGFVHETASDYVPGVVFCDVFVQPSGSELFHANSHLTFFQVNGQNLRFNYLPHSQHILRLITPFLGADVADVHHALNPF